MVGFAPDTIYCDIGFGRLRSTMGPSGNLLIPIRLAFPAAMQSGDPRDLDRLLVDCLDGKTWGWPWLEEWQVRFEAEGQFPYAWEEARKKDHRLPWRIALLSYTVFCFVHDARRWADTCRLFEKHGWKPGMPFPENNSLYSGWKLYLLPPEPPYVEDCVRAGFARFLAGDHGHRPPYFPGDRSDISFQIRKR